MTMDKPDGQDADSSIGPNNTRPMELLAMAAARAAGTLGMPQPMQGHAASPQGGQASGTVFATNASLDTLALPPSTPTPPPPIQGTKRTAAKSGAKSRGGRSKQGTGRGSGSVGIPPVTITGEDITSGSILDTMELDPLPPDQTLDRRPQPLATKPVYKKRTTNQAPTLPVPSSSLSSSSSSTVSVSSPSPTVSATSSSSTVSATSSSRDGIIRRGGIDLWRERRMDSQQAYQRPRALNAYDLSTQIWEKKLLGSSHRKRYKKGEAGGGAYSSTGSKTPKTVGESLARHQSAMLERMEKLYTRPLPHRDVVRMLQMELDAEEQTLQRLEERLGLEMSRLKVEEEVLLELLEMSADPTVDMSMLLPKEGLASERGRRPTASDTTVATTATATTAAAPGSGPARSESTAEPAAKRIRPSPTVPPSVPLSLPPTVPSSVPLSLLATMSSSVPLSLPPTVFPSAPQSLPPTVSPSVPLSLPPSLPPTAPHRAEPSQKTPMSGQQPTPAPKPTGRKRSVVVRATQEPPAAAAAATVAHITPSPLYENIPLTLSPTIVSIPIPTAPVRVVSQPTAAAGTTHTKRFPFSGPPMHMPSLPTPKGVDNSDSSFMAALSILEQHEQAEEKRQQQGEEDEEGETEEEGSESGESGEDEDEDEEDDFDEEDEEAARSALRSMLAQIGGGSF